MGRDVRFEIPPETKPTSCRGCSRRVYWILTAKGKRMPVDPDGTSHFVTCPDAAKFRKLKAAKCKGSR